MRTVVEVGGPQRVRDPPGVVHLVEIGVESRRPFGHIAACDALKHGLPPRLALCAGDCCSVVALHRVPVAEGGADDDNVNILQKRHHLSRSQALVRVAVPLLLGRRQPRDVRHRGNPSGCRDELAVAVVVGGVVALTHLPALESSVFGITGPGVVGNVVEARPEHFLLLADLVGGGRVADPALARRLGVVQYLLLAVHEDSDILDPL
mmetsp:Transcript_32696/g.77519  ORF Transcript_32696/g.77519 Transcript_32696/m.77519 type:complete len:207 (+) Transcript_32696:481-1101(+)